MTRPRKRPIRINTRELLPILLPNKPLQPKQMPIHALPIRSPRGILQMPCHRLPEQPSTLDVRYFSRGVEHRFDEGTRLGGGGTDHFCAAELEFARLGGFVDYGGPGEEFVEGELFD